MEDVEQAILGFDWDADEKSKAMYILTPEVVAKLSGLPPDILKRVLEMLLLQSGELSSIGCEDLLPYL